MTIQPGDMLPEVNLMTMGRNGPMPVSTRELFDGKRSVLFAVPGAFTPTCSAQHLPGYIRHAPDFRARGIDQLVCMSVNDVFVMDAWASSAGVDSEIVMAADGNGDLARALGLEMDGSAFGMGNRCQRFAMIVQDGKVESLFVEGPGEFKVSSAENVLEEI